MSTDAVNSAQIAMLIKSNTEIKDVLVDTNKNMSDLVKAQVRTEERQAADREWQKRVESHQDKQDEKIEQAQRTADGAKNQALSNGKWINLGVAILTGILIFVAQQVIKMVWGG